MTKASVELQTLIGVIERLRGELETGNPSRDAAGFVVRACDAVVRTLSYAEVASPMRFRLIRDEDVSGVSGVGHIADGVEWSSGRVTLQWEGERASLSHWDSLEDMLACHGHGGRTRVEWLDSGLPACPQRDTSDFVAALEAALRGVREAGEMVPSVAVMAEVVRCLEMAVTVAGELADLRVRFALVGRALSV